MANTALVFGAYRPTGEMGKLANLLRDGRPRLTAEVIKTIATKRPRERLVTLARQGRTPNLKSQTHLWDLDLETDLICMTNIRGK
jgi:hypothetical protein